MKIIGSVTSPFTRAVRVACEELGIPHEFETTPPFAKLTPGQEAIIRTHNPLMKVPILIDGDMEILDSRVIIQHLLKHPSGSGFAGPENIPQENILTVIYGILDAGILRFILKTSHAEIDADKGYMARSLGRVRDGLAWLEKQPDLGRTFGVAEALLLCALEWIHKRDICAWNDLPGLVRIHEKFRDRPSLVKTRIPDAA
jgi:glutathione S-transferase